MDGLYDLYYNNITPTSFSFLFFICVPSSHSRIIHNNTTCRLPITRSSKKQIRKLRKIQKIRNTQ